MKKFLDSLTKGKWGQDNIYNLYDASVSHKINNQFKENSIFKYYSFDSNSYNSVELGNEILFGSREEVKSDSHKFAESLCNPHLIASTVDSQSKKDLELTKNNLDSDHIVSEVEKKTKGRPTEKYKENLYLIKISNSRYFHIGSQKTINVSKNPITSETLQGCEALPSATNDFSQLKIAFGNCEKILTEKYISLISKYMNGQWKGFFECLGLEKTVLEKLELRYDDDRILSIYDALHRYLMLFPNTSLGFVICALGEIHQVIVAEKLLQEINT